jgi:hypothetical protein
MLVKVKSLVFCLYKPKMPEVKDKETVDLLGDGVHGSGQVVDILRSNTGHRDATILGQIHAELLHQAFTLLRIHAGEAEHADLVGDVLPVLGRAQLLQVVLQRGAHRNDAVGHLLDVAQPLLLERGIAQNLRHQTSTVHGRVRVQGTDEDLDLRHCAHRIVFAAGHQREGAGTFAVQAHVLGVALGQGDLVALLDEMSDGEGVTGDVTAGEALVGHVEEGEEVALLDQIGQFGPLFGLGVDAGGIVGAGVQQDDGAFGDFLKGKIGRTRLIRKLGSYLILIN